MGTNVHEVWRLIMGKGWGMTSYTIHGKPCTEEEYLVARGEYMKMDPFKRRAQIFAKEFKLDDSKFFVCALEAVMKSVHEEVVGKEQKPFSSSSRREEYITEERLKRFKGILQSMRDGHSQHTGWSYQKRGNLLRLADFVIGEIENLWEEIEVWKEQFERLGEKRDRWKEENEILKKGLKNIDPVYSIECTNDRSCMSCGVIYPDDGKFFPHKPGCAWLAAVNLTQPL